MNQIELLRNYIQQEFTGAKLVLTEPLREGGFWSLDIDWVDKKLAVEWSEKTGFGVSNIDPEGYGERTDEAYGTLKEIKQRIHRLLTSAERTAPPFGILLSRLREYRKITQQELARKLGVKQATVSGMENREDVQLGTLWRAVEVLGGTIEIYGVFPEARYRIDVRSQKGYAQDQSLCLSAPQIETGAVQPKLNYEATFVGLNEAGCLQRVTQLANQISSRRSVIEFV